MNSTPAGDLRLAALLSAYPAPARPNVAGVAATAPQALELTPPANREPLEGGLWLPDLEEPAQ